MKLKNRTTLVSAFPGTGKSYFFRESRKSVLDSDSSTFDKVGFPENYIFHIKENIGKADIIFISSHKEVREALVENNLDFTLVYPSKDQKDTYIERYKKRGSPQGFIDLLTKNWDAWITELEQQRNCTHIVLKEDEFMSDVFFL